MWEVYEHRRLVRRIPRLPVELLKRYEKWKDIVRVSGPVGIRQIKGFHDEALRGEWRGYRSSRLGGQYRIVYEVLSQEVRVHVIDITAHEYRRR
ncbi:MAG: type II toxin-antitoxin system mRNA interferase toxin, RelE/StbE family [Candidatus Eisenbacteria sp.]|nr:type II toxin-antitoxin system mRNA interferase toxin, RelE/StbE family [Candidatus Eisenbacteria bacterium]